MSKPMHADRWYETPNVDELRQEFQNAYRIIDSAIDGVNIDNYYNKTEVDNLLDAFYTSTEVDALVTPTAILTKLLTVDGPGSGLNADLLDGYDHSDLAKLSGAAFTGTVDAPTLEQGGTPLASIFASLAGATFTGPVDAPGISVGSDAVWHTGNFTPSYTGAYTLAANGAITYIPDADIPRQGTLWLSASGDETPGGGLIDIYRHGRYNQCHGLSVTGRWVFGGFTKADPGAGPFRMWIENNSSGARLAIRNMVSYTRSIAFMSIPSIG